jgi:RNA polymerase sigma-70 factor (ECF subfamily)
VGLSELDRNLLQRCLQREPRAWENFVDRFLGVVVHVIQHTAQSRSLRVSPQDRDDLAAEVFLTLINEDYAVLRRFRGQSSLATYLTVIARRVVVRELLKRKTASGLNEETASEAISVQRGPSDEERISDRDEIEQILRTLHGPEADVIRMYHLEGKTYREISTKVGMPENTIGPTLSRARAKMRKAGIDAAGR